MNRGQSHRTPIFSDFPRNRYDALEQAERLLRFKPSEWEYFLKILQKAEGWLSFTRGGIEIEWMHHGENDTLQLSFIISTGHFETSAVYTFNLQELAHLKNDTQLGIEDCETE
jgi:hypothetical protein